MHKAKNANTNVLAFFYGQNKRTDLRGAECQRVTDDAALEVELL